MLLSKNTFLRFPKAWKNDLGLIALFFFFVTILVLAPAIYRPSIFQVMGGDAYHNLWIWGRNVSNVMAGSAPYAPNIFFPDPLSSFYSEMEVGNSLLYGLLSAIGLHPIRSYLVIVIMAFALTGIMVALIARRLGASTTAAILGGSIAAFTSYRYNHLSHVQALATYWMLIPLYFSLSYLLDGRRRDLVLAGIAHLPVLCGPSYNLIALFLLECGIFLAFVLNGALDARLRWRRAGSFVLSVAFAALLTIPFWLGYLELFRKGYARVHSDTFSYAIDLSGFFLPPNSSLIYGYMSDWIEATGQQRLSMNAFFIGFIALGLIVMALFRRQPVTSVVPANATNRFRYLFVMQWVGIVMLALSLGEVVLWNKLYIVPNPIFKIGESMYLLSATRYIAHYAYFGVVAFSIVVACRFSELPSNLRKATRSKLHIALAIFVVLENFVLYAPHLRRFPVSLSEPPPVYKQLAKLPSGKGVVFLPLPTQVSNEDDAFQRQYQYIFNAQHHRLAMFNGLAGFFPPHYTQGLGLMAEFPNLPGLNFILKNQIDYVVHDKHSGRAMDFSEDKMKLLCGALLSVYSDSDYEVFQIDRVRGMACVAKAGSSALAQWVFRASTGTPHQIGRFDSSIMAMVSNPGDQGALAFGPYIVLENGKYRASFSIKATAKREGIEVGTLDVNGYSNKIPNRLYKTIPIHAGPLKQELHIEFEVVDPTLKHEFRVWSNGSGTIEFYKVGVEKL